MLPSESTRSREDLRIKFDFDKQSAQLLSTKIKTFDLILRAPGDICITRSARSERRLNLQSTHGNIMIKQKLEAHEIKATTENKARSIKITSNTIVLSRRIEFKSTLTTVDGSISAPPEGARDVTFITSGDCLITLAGKIGKTHSDHNKPAHDVTVDVGKDIFNVGQITAKRKLELSCDNFLFPDPYNKRFMGDSAVLGFESYVRLHDGELKNKQKVQRTISAPARLTADAPGKRTLYKIRLCSV